MKQQIWFECTVQIAKTSQNGYEIGNATKCTIPSINNVAESERPQAVHSADNVLVLSLANARSE